MHCSKQREAKALHFKDAKQSLGFLCSTQNMMCQMAAFVQCSRERRTNFVQLLAEDCAKACFILIFALFLLQFCSNWFFL